MARSKGQRHEEIQLLPVEDLRLDPHNPRLPEDKTNLGQDELLEYLAQREDLDELAQSMADNGFFAHEPLLVEREQTKAKKPTYVVIEGNRRLAALSLLLGLPAARGKSLNLPLTRSVRADLQLVPCIVTTRDAARKFLGFRHINGLRTWPANAKARYVADEVERLHRAGSSDPFYDAGRRLGGNSQGIRTQFLSIRLLRHSADAFNINTYYLMNERFGVWYRMLSSGGIRSYLGIDDARTYDEVNAAVARVPREALEQIIGDLTPQDSKPAVISDSRQITVYGKILLNKQALKTLRKTGNVAIAARIVAQSDLPGRIMDAATLVQALVDEAQRTEMLENCRKPAEQLFLAARALRGIVSTTES